MNFHSSLLFIATVLLVNLTACSYIKSLFPDKGKDYQYTTEIPPLVLPPDLKEKSAAENLPDTIVETAPKPEVAVSDEISTNSNSTPASEAKSEPVVSKETTETPVIEAVEKNEKISVELVKFNDGENRLKLSVEKPRAWRLVSKALSRKSIEVTNRNQDEGFFVVQYDPEDKQVKDGSLWDEAVFIFSGFQSNEKEYQLRLQENDRKTDVIILDKDKQPLSNDSNGLKLLTTLQEAINTDLASN